MFSIPELLIAALVVLAAWLVARWASPSHRRAITGMAIGMLSQPLLLGVILLLFMGRFLLMGQIGSLQNAYFAPSKLFWGVLGYPFDARLANGPGASPMDFWFSAGFYGVLGWLLGHLLDRRHRRLNRPGEEGAHERLAVAGDC
jgi:hypothetical protein